MAQHEMLGKITEQTNSHVFNPEFSLLGNLCFMLLLAKLRKKGIPLRTVSLTEEPDYFDGLKESVPDLESKELCV